MGILTDEMMKKAAHHHPNPSVRHGRELAMKDLSKHDKNDEPGEHGHEKDVEEHGPIHRAHVESEGGKHTVVAHHEDGHIGRHEHGDLASAHAQHAAMMGEGEGREHEANESPEFEAAEQEGQSESCPSCGGEMKDGKCQTCGYQEQDDQGPEENEQ